MNDCCDKKNPDFGARQNCGQSPGLSLTYISQARQVILPFRISISLPVKWGSYLFETVKDFSEDQRTSEI